jgi:hypothetical protein
MTDEELQRLLRENEYLKLRCAQLQGDVTDLDSQVARLQQTLERTSAVRVAARVGTDTQS